jgi:hypothetical protein
MSSSFIRNSTPYAYNIAAEIILSTISMTR